MVVVCIEAVAVGAPMEADGGGGGTLLFELGIGEGVLPMLFLKMKWDSDWICKMNRRAELIYLLFPDAGRS